MYAVATASPDINERTRLTSSPSMCPRSTRFSCDDSSLVEGPAGTGLGSSIGGIVGGSLFRGAKGSRRVVEVNEIRDTDRRRQTTVRLLRSGSPESAC